MNPDIQTGDPKRKISKTRNAGLLDTPSFAFSTSRMRKAISFLLVAEHPRPHFRVTLQ